MNQNKTELAVAALCNGTVIDRIPSHALFKAVQLLGIEDMPNAVTIGNNLDSAKLGKKGIIKVADLEVDQNTLNRIALIAPNAVVNTIRDFTVVDKSEVELPDEIVGIVRCNNPKCISNHEPMPTRFCVVSRNPVEIRCHYCNHSVAGDKAALI